MRLQCPTCGHDLVRAGTNDSNEGVYWCWRCGTRSHESRFCRGQLVTVDAPDYVAQRKELLAALKGVVRVADRKTNEFDAARAAIAMAESA